MKKYLLIILLAAGISGLAYAESLDEALGLLKTREDARALAIFEKIITTQPDNLQALWGKAEVKRRARNYKKAEAILDKILKKDPGHAPSLISLSYIRYKDDKLPGALQLIEQVLKIPALDRENQALCYMMLGSINSRRSKKGWLVGKIRYGARIKGYFLKAKSLATDLPEVHLGLGTFYLLAPKVVGGSLDKALEELELTVKLAPSFATANARLAQAYKKRGNLEKYKIYLQRVKELDPENEALNEEL
ncbi:MAG TPA: tetratricopeptide repeat protein [Candidatus Omnitrophota bacterium]|nr:tetratricopeptide repeat protein [Candidatus Omnitrophota bacterium]